MQKNNIKRLRTENGLSQGDLGKLFHVGQSSVNKWETGRNNPTMEQAIKLASHFNVSLDFLMGLTAEQGTTFNAYHNKAPVHQAGGNLTIGETKLTNEEIEIVQTIRQSDMQTKVKILNFFIELKNLSDSQEVQSG